MQETRANTASIVESVRIMEQSSGNIHRLAADGAENSSQIQERAGEMERISTLSRLSRERDLTAEEKAEQFALRNEYIAEVRSNLQLTLEHTYIQKPDGSREKLRQNPEKIKQ